MNANRKLASHLFSSALRDALGGAHGRLPSAAKFADAFNLRAHGTNTITRETARKWLRGDTMPEIGKMRVLIHWLNLDPSSFLRPITVTGHTDRPVESDSASDRRNARQALVEILPYLDDQSVEALCLTAAAMQALRRKENETARIDAAGLGLC